MMMFLLRITHCLVAWNYVHIKAMQKKILIVSANATILSWIVKMFIFEWLDLESISFRDDDHEWLTVYISKKDQKKAWIKSI